jgi:hypothetical protein
MVAVQVAKQSGVRVPPGSKWDVQDARQTEATVDKLGAPVLAAQSLSDDWAQSDSKSDALGAFLKAAFLPAVAALLGARAGSGCK